MSAKRLEHRLGLTPSPGSRGPPADVRGRGQNPAGGTAISYWLIGFPAAYGLAFWTGWGAIGVWIGLSIGTAVYAVLLVLRFRLLANRLEQVR